MKTRLLCAFLLFLGIGIVHGSAHAELSSPAGARVARVLDRFVNGQTLVVAAVELDERWVTGLDQYLVGRMGPDANQIANQPNTQQALQHLKELRDQGAREAVLLFGLDDSNVRTGPLVVITVEKPAQTPGLASALTAMFRDGGGDLPRLKAVSVEGWVLIGQPAALENYRQIKPSSRPTLQQVATLLDRGTDGADAPRAAVACSLSDDARRVITSLWPNLPEPFEGLNADVVGQFKQLQGIVVCPPQWRLDMKMDAGNEQAAEVVAAAASSLRDMYLSMLFGKSGKSGDASPDSEDSTDARQAVADALQIERSGSTLALQIDHADQQVTDMMTSQLTRAVQQSRDDALRIGRMNNAKQLALGLLNYESANRRLPACGAFTDEQGKPLLSWRVAILPYLEETELYEQFHLDEPWDSPHNRQLLTKMPKVFADTRYPELAAIGKTTFAVPVHPESVFPPVTAQTLRKKITIGGKTVWMPEGTSYRQIKDGTVKTLLVVELPKEQAIEWTRPTDWEVDLANAWRQLLGKRQAGVVTVFCDCHAQVLGTDQVPYDEQLPGLITRDGRDNIYSE